MTALSPASSPAYTSSSDSDTSSSIYDPSPRATPRADDTTTMTLEVRRSKLLPLVPAAEVDFLTLVLKNWERTADPTAEDDNDTTEDRLPTLLPIDIVKKIIFEYIYGFDINAERAAQQALLKHLDQNRIAIRGSPAHYFPPQAYELTPKYIRINNFSNLREIPPSWYNLEAPESFTNLSLLTELEHLKYLHVKDCPNFSQSAEIQALQPKIRALRKAVAEIHNKNEKRKKLIDLIKRSCLALAASIVVILIFGGILYWLSLCTSDDNSTGDNNSTST